MDAILSFLGNLIMLIPKLLIFLINLILKLVGLLLNLLPDSPFQMLEKNEEVSKVLGYVNYFVPFDFVVSVGTAWLVAVGLFYVVQFVLRWVKAIE